MLSYSLSHRAASDLQTIFAYTGAKFGRSQAMIYRDGLIATLALLAEIPEMGRSADHIRHGVRRHEHKSHVIFYRQDVFTIVILRVLPARANWKEHL